jgi:hypothetical protein
MSDSEICTIRGVSNITSFTLGWTKTATEFSIAWILLFTVGCGLMAVKGKKLFSTFLNSLPPMP